MYLNQKQITPIYGLSSQIYTEATKQHLKKYIKDVIQKPIQDQKLLEILIDWIKT